MLFSVSEKMLQVMGHAPLYRRCDLILGLGWVLPKPGNTDHVPYLVFCSFPALCTLAVWATKSKYGVKLFLQLHFSVHRQSKGEMSEQGEHPAGCEERRAMWPRGWAPAAKFTWFAPMLK